MVPDRSATGQVAPHLPQDHPLPATLVADCQLLWGHEEIVANLEEHVPSKCRQQDDGCARWEEDPPGGRGTSRPERAAEDRQRVGQRQSHHDGDAGDRQQVVVLPVETGEGDLEPGSQRPGRDQAARCRRVRAEDQVGQGRHRDQPERPAPGAPPDQVVGRSERPGQLTPRVGVAGQPPDRSRRSVPFRQGIGRQRPAIQDDVIVSGPAPAPDQEDCRRDGHDRDHPQGHREDRPPLIPPSQGGERQRLPPS